MGNRKRWLLFYVIITLCYITMSIVPIIFITMIFICGFISSCSQYFVFQKLKPGIAKQTFCKIALLFTKHSIFSGFRQNLRKVMAPDPGLELSRRDSSTIWRRGWRRRIPAWSSAGGIAVPFGEEHSGDRSRLGAQPVG